MQERLIFVDGLRGIAAISVVLHHYIGRVDLPSLSWFRFGNLGVEIFFALSGFVIAMTTDRRELSFGFLGRFALRRMVRLDLPYWASLGFLLIIAIFGARYGAHQDVPTLDQLVAHMFYLQNWLGYEPMSEVYWSLCYEVQFYLMLILLVMGLRRVFGSEWHTRAVMIFCALIILSLIDRDIGHWSPRGFSFVFWFNFGAGALTYWVTAGRVSAIYLFACLACMTAMGLALDDEFAICAAATCALLYAAHALGAMQKWLSANSWQFLGRISYSLYILHSIMGWYAMSIAQRFVHDGLALAIGIAVAIGSSWIAYLLIERPSIHLSRKIRLNPKVEPVPIPT